MLDINKFMVDINNNIIMVSTIYYNPNDIPDNQEELEDYFESLPDISPEYTIHDTTNSIEYSRYYLRKGITVYDNFTGNNTLIGTPNIKLNIKDISPLIAEKL